VGARETGHRLAQPTRWQQPLHKRVLRRVDEHNVELPRQSAVLESVVEHDHVHRFAFWRAEQLQELLHAIWSDGQRHAGQGGSMELSLIAQVVLRGVSPQRDCGMVAGFEKPSADQLHGRRLAGAANAEIAHADDRPVERDAQPAERERFGLGALIEAGVAIAHDTGVDALGQRCEGAQ